MARVLIIGGHGKVAMLLAPLLVARGERVTAVIRNPEHRAEVAATGAVPVVADIERLDLAGFTDLLGGHDAVVWSAGAGGGAPARTRAVDQDAAIRAIQAAAAAGIDRFVMVSYLGARLDHEVPQDHPFFAYAEAKAAADAFLRDSGLEWTILAPGPLTLGEPTGLIETVSPGEGRVSRADVAAVAAAVLAEPSTIRRTLSFGAGATPIAQAISFAEGVPAQG